MSLAQMTIAELGSAFREGSLTPLELTEHYLSRIARLDPELHAFTELTRERALAEARVATQEITRGEVRGPLHGIPYAVKDFFDVSGVATTAGCSLRRHKIAEQDCNAVSRLSRAGMILLGTNHSVQFGCGVTGINQDMGTPRNPWGDEHCIPGGSSSGSGVAVAGGLAPVALGGDTGGSVRVPAALCGIVGLKTTLGRIGRSDVHPMAPTLDTIGVFGRHVQDTALVYQQLHGTDPKDPSTHKLPVGQAEPASIDVKEIRVAVPETVVFDDCDPEVERVVRECVELLSGLVHSIENQRIQEMETVHNMPKRFLISACETYVSNKTLFDESKALLDPIVSWVDAGRDALAVDYLDAVGLHRKVSRSVLKTLEDIDAVVTPTTLLPALSITSVAPNLGTYEETYQNDPSERYARNASMANMLGLCGITVPCGLTAGGMPIGLQFLAKPFREDVLFALAAAFERARSLDSWVPR